MNEFLLININNFESLFNLDGLIQIAGIIAAVILSYIGACLFARRIHQKLLQASKFWRGMLDKAIRPSFFILLSSFLGMIIDWVDKSSAVLIFSATIIGVIVLIVKSILYSLDYGLQTNKYRKQIKNTLKFVIIILVLFWSTNLDMVLAEQLGKIVLHFGKSQLSLWDFLRETILILLALAVMLLATIVLDGWIKNIRDIDNNLKQLLLRISKILVVIVGVFMVLPSLGFDLTALSVLGGAIGVGIGFGLQKIASNFLSGFIILLDKSIKIGDRIIINNVTGTVTKITTRYVVMQGFDGSEMLIPNEKFITDPVINQTYSNTDIGIELVVSVGYSSDLVLVIDTLRQCIAKIDEINQDKEPSVYIQKLNESGIDVFLRV